MTTTTYPEKTGANLSFCKVQRAPMEKKVNRAGFSRRPTTGPVFEGRVAPGSE